jgi:hypothetical protein
MGESDGPRFACTACGREFRWRPELAGKKAKCKCGAVVAVPLQAPLALEPAPPEPVPIHADDDPFAAFDRGASSAHADASAALPPPPPPSNSCPVCGTAALPTAVMCTSCGYNFRTGLKTPGFGRPAARRETDGGGAIAADTYQLAAKVSWMAPLVGLLLGCCIVGAAVKGSPVLTGVLAILQLLLILAGLGLGIFALTGVKRNGPEGILVPSIVGMSLSGVIVLLGVIGAVMQASGRGPAGGASRVANAVAAADAQRIGQQMAAGAGWMGVAQHKGATIVLITMSDGTPVVEELLQQLGTPVTVAVLGVDNSNAAGSFTVDPTGGRVDLVDGTSQPLPDMAQALGTMKADRDGALRRFSPPFPVEPGQRVEDKLVFLPPGTNPDNIVAVSIKIDGRMRKLTGKMLSAGERQQLMQGRGKK